MMKKLLPRSRRQAGFSLIEILVTLSLMGLTTVAIILLLDRAHEVSTSQTIVAEMQNNHRVAQQELIRMISMAGLGGLPDTVDPTLPCLGTAANVPCAETAGVFPNGLGLAVANNVEAAGNDPASPSDTFLVAGNNRTLVVEGTDVVTVRGVYSTPVFYALNLLGQQQPVSIDEATETMQVVITDSVDAGVIQSTAMDQLRRALDNDGDLATLTPAAALRAEAFIVRDRYNPGIFAVLELDPANTNLGVGGDTTMTIGLKLGNTVAQSYNNQYGRMILGTTLLADSGGNRITLPDATQVQLPNTIGTIGLLEEYRFFVREAWEVAGDNTTRLRPVLSRAKFYPGTNVLYPDAVNPEILDVADDVIDLQVALGVDLPPLDNQVLDSDNNTDEVLYNHPADNDGLADGTRPWAATAAQLRFVRLSVVAQGPRPDRKFEGVILGTFEDRDHAQAGHVSVFNSVVVNAQGIHFDYTKVRKRYLTTVVEPRNL